MYTPNPHNPRYRPQKYYTKNALLSLNYATCGAKEMQPLINKGADVNIKDADLKPLFCKMAIVGNLKGMKCLVKNGVDIEIASKYGASALFEAAFWGHHEIVHYLIDIGVNVNKPSVDNETALISAVCGKHNGIVPLLLQAGANPNIVPSHGYGPLHFAAYSHHVENVHDLRAYGASMLAMNNKYQLPIDLCDWRKNYELYAFFKKETDIDMHTQPRLITSKIKRIRPDLIHSKV